MRIKFWIIFAALVLAGPLLHADDWSKTYPVTGTPELRVDSGDGSIDVTAWDRPEIAVHVTTKGWSIGQHGVRIDEHQAGNLVELELHFPHEGFSFGIVIREVHIAIQVPRQLTADLHTSDGHIEVTGAKGNLTFRSGDGHITAEDVDGSVRIKTNDGRVRTSGRFDALDIHTGDGSVEAQARPGSKATTEWSLTTGDGHINLALPADFSAGLEIHTGDGKITSDLPITMSGVFGRNDLRGKLNSGGPLLRIRTGDWSIRLARM